MRPEIREPDPFAPVKIVYVLGGDVDAFRPISSSRRTMVEEGD